MGSLEDFSAARFSVAMAGERRRSPSDVDAEREPSGGSETRWELTMMKTKSLELSVLRLVPEEALKFPAAKAPTTSSCFRCSTDSESAESERGTSALLSSLPSPSLSTRPT